MDIEIPVGAPVADDVAAISYLPCIGGYGIREVNARESIIAE